MRVHFVDSDTKPPVRNPDDRENIDSDLIFDFDMEEDRPATPTTASQAVDVEDASTSHQTVEDLAPAEGNNEALTTGSSAHRSESPRADLNAPSTSETPAITVSAEENNTLEARGDVNAEAPGHLDARARAFLAKIPQPRLFPPTQPARLTQFPQLSQLARPPAWYHNTSQPGPSNATSQSGPSITAGPPSYRSSMSRVASNSPLAPHPHELHQPHHYVTNRGLGFPNWRAVSSRSSDTNHQDQWQQYRQQQPPPPPPQPQPQPQPQYGQQHVYQHYSHIVPQNGTVYQNRRLPQATPFAAGQFPFHNVAQQGQNWIPFHPTGYVSAQYAQHQAPLRPNQWQAYGYLRAPYQTQPSYWERHSQPYGQSTTYAPGPATGPVVQAPAAQVQAPAAQSQVQVAESGPPRPRVVFSRPLIVDGSNRNYDVDLLNRRAYGDLYTSTSNVQTTGASMPSLVSDNNTATGRHSVTSPSTDVEPALINASASGTTERKVPLSSPQNHSPGSESGAVPGEDASPAAALATACDAGASGSSDDALFVVPPHPSTYKKAPSEAVPHPPTEDNSTPLENVAATETSDASNEPDVVGLPGSPEQSTASPQPASAPYQALTVNLSKTYWLVKLPPDFWQRLAQHADFDTVMRLSTINRAFFKAHVKTGQESKKQTARLAETEEGSVSVASQVHRFELAPREWDGNEGNQKSCRSCFVTRMPMCFPRVFRHEVNYEPAKTQKLYQRSLLELMTPDRSRTASRPQPPPLLEPARPLFVPYIPVPSEFLTTSANTDPSGSYESVCGGNALCKLREEFDLSEFHRCCLDCAVVRGLLKPGQLVVALDGTWRWVCKCLKVQFGTSDRRACGECHDVPY